jgi:hypothetical protein
MHILIVVQLVVLLDFNDGCINVAMVIWIGPSEGSGPLRLIWLRLR